MNRLVTTVTAAWRTGAAAIAIVELILIGTAVSARGPPKINADGYQMRRIVRAGEAIRLQCPVDAAADPIITWLKDGDEVRVGWDRYRLHDNTLRVRDVNPADSGVYVCRATNGFGTVDVRFLVYVGANDSTLPPDDFDEGIFHPPGADVAPTFTDDGSPFSPFLTPAAGTTVRLFCRASGVPKPEVTWSKDNMELHPQDGVVTSLSSGDGRDTLLLPEVTQTDSGRYSCKVSNRAGTITRNYVVQVDVSETDRSQSILPPHPENATVNVGGVATFLCHVHSTSDHVPNIQWLKRLDSARDPRRRNATLVTHAGDQYAVLVASQQATATGGSQSIQTVPHGDGTYTSRLTLPEVAEVDVGLYVCVVLGRHGGRSYRSAFLTVAPATDFSGRSGHSDATSTAETGYIGYLPIVAAFGAVGTILLLAIIGFVVYRRRTGTSKSSSPSMSATSGGGGTSGTVGASSSLLLSSGSARTGGSGGTSLQSQRRAAGHPVAGMGPPSAGVMAHYAELVDRYPGAGQPGHVLVSGGSGWTGGSASPRCQGVPLDTTSYSDYSSISRTIGVVAPPTATPSHMYALQHHQQQQLSNHHPHLYQLQMSPPGPAVTAAAAAAAMPVNRLHYYDGC